MKGNPLMSKRTLEITYGGAPMSPTAAAKWLGCSDKRVRQLCADGELAPIKVTKGDKGVRRYQIYPTAIDAYIRRHSSAA